MTFYRSALLCALCVVISAAFTTPEAAWAQKKVKPKPATQPQAQPDHAALTAAERLLKQAKASAEKDPLPEFGGHRMKGITHINHAEKSLKAAIKAAAKGGKKTNKGGKGAGKGAGKGDAKAKGPDKQIAKAVQEMDRAIQEFSQALIKYNEHHKGMGRVTGLHQAEQLVRQAKKAAVSALKK